MFLPTFMTSEHPGSHVFQQTRTIFIHIQIHIRKNAPLPGGHVFQATGTIFQLVQDVIGTNLLTKFYDDRTINMASRVLTKKNNTPPWRPYIIGTNRLTKKNAPPPGFNKYKEVKLQLLEQKNALPPGGHVFKATETIFELIQDIIGTNLLTKFHEDRKINVASRVLTRFYYSHIMKNAPPPDIIGTNLLTKFHEDRTVNVALRVLTRQMLTPHAGQKAITKAHHEHVVLR
ncbi:hypothetical protein DPMN_016793 [Dreissena polymorpha]|uniref:Uncharacterized protein n=1 Tax=Dreissena polymorpha TaxID=45954 RepID=A0A9D4NBX9_DREPO|nr:hypothetical protein DPMN_016793 [Dreissena polymorpha]